MNTSSGDASAGGAGNGLPALVGATTGLVGGSGTFAGTALAAAAPAGRLPALSSEAVWLLTTGMSGPVTNVRTLRGEIWPLSSAPAAASLAGRSAVAGASPALTGGSRPGPAGAMTREFGSSASPE